MLFFRLMLLVFISFTGCANRHALPEIASSTVVPEEVRLPRPIDVSTAPDVTDRVAIQTNYGTIVLGLYGKDAPITVQNFLQYVEREFYTGKVFHRVISGFMIQGGGFNETLTRDTETAEPVRVEIIPGLRHVSGVLSMARANSPHSATSQFFICVGEARQLNGLYSIFGEVEEGMDVVSGISVVKTAPQESSDGVLDDVPVKPVIIESITLL